MNIVSRGGSLVFAWMCMTGEENPFYVRYDEILDICREYDVTISLGDACRPGCLADATDVCQIEELVRRGELTRRAWEKDVQVMVEGPGLGGAVGLRAGPGNRQGHPGGPLPRARRLLLHVRQILRCAQYEQGSERRTHRHSVTGKGHLVSPNSLLCSSHRKCPCDSLPLTGAEHEKELGPSFFSPCAGKYFMGV